MNVGDLSQSERDEIEAKVLQFRKMVTAAAIRRAEQRKARDPAKWAQREKAKELEHPAKQIELLRRLLAGEKMKDVAAEYGYGPGWLRDRVWHIVSDELDYQSDNDNCEWMRCLQAKPAEQRWRWWPIAIERISLKI